MLIAFSLFKFYFSVKERIGVVIVDPNTNTILAQGHDLRRGNNPLQHAVLVGLDLVARAQGGGMWTFTGKFCPTFMYIAKILTSQFLLIYITTVNCCWLITEINTTVINYIYFVIHQQTTTIYNYFSTGCPALF